MKIYHKLPNNIENYAKIFKNFRATNNSQQIKKYPTVLEIRKFNPYFSTLFFIQYQ